MNDNEKIIKDACVWEILQKCSFLQENKEELLLRGCNLLNPTSIEDRWMKVLPLGQTIQLAENYTEDGKDRECLYKGNGMVFDKFNIHVLTWASCSIRQNVRYIIDSPYTRGVRNCLFAVNIVLLRCSDWKRYDVPVKVFDFINLEDHVSHFNINTDRSFVWSCKIIEVERPVVGTPPTIIDTRKLSSNQYATLSETKKRRGSPPENEQTTQPENTNQDEYNKEEKRPKFLYEVAYKRKANVVSETDEKADNCMLSTGQRITCWQKHRGWESCSKCIVCGEAKINRDENTHFAHKFARSKGGRGDKTYNFTPQCSACNIKYGKEKNMFDQLFESGRGDLILILSEISRQLYLCQEIHVDYTFKGRADFIKRVFGDHRIEGGIKSNEIFILLQGLDDLNPLPEHERNPKLYNINLLNKFLL